MKTKNKLKIDDLVGKQVGYKYGDTYWEGELEKMGDMYIIDNHFFKKGDYKDITIVDDIYTLWF